MTKKYMPIVTIARRHESLVMMLTEDKDELVIEVDGINKDLQRAHMFLVFNKPELSHLINNLEHFKLMMEF